MPTKSTAPPPRTTMEIDMSWLEDEGQATPTVLPQAKSKGKLPPPIPGAVKNPPPMPVERSASIVPARRITVEVRAEWLEEALEPATTSKRPSRLPAAGEEARHSKSVAPPAKRAGSRSSTPPKEGGARRGATIPPKAEAPKRTKRPVIPRED